MEKLFVVWKRTFYKDVFYRYILRDEIFLYQSTRLSSPCSSNTYGIVDYSTCGFNFHAFIVHACR